MKQELKQEVEPCQYYYPDLACITMPDPRIALPLRRVWWLLKRYVWYISILGPRGFASRILPSTIPWKFAFKRKRKSHAISRNNEVLNLQPGEWVKVRSVKEIFATLNAKGKLRGLRFIPEMVKFCGKRFKVYKRLDKIILEATGELRKIRTPTVLLEGVFCDGKAHSGCDRSCFCFWREAWLKRETPQNPQEQETRV